MKLEELKSELMKDKDFKKEYERFDFWFEIEELWIKINMFLIKIL